MLGFLGNMTSAPCCITMGSAALLCFLRKATFEMKGLSTSSIVTNATMDGRYYGFRTSTDIKVCVGICSREEWFEDRLSTDVLVCRARGTHEFLRWMVKTFDRRGW
jgi:hypothetical protein